MMGFVIGSAAVPKLVLARDCSDCDPNTLTDVYRLDSEMHFDAGLSWFFCGGLGVAMGCMGKIKPSTKVTISDIFR